MTDAAAPKPTFQERIGRWLGRRTIAMLLLGFASGLPFLLVFDTLSIWMRDAGVSLTAISVAGLTTLVYAFKFLWAPVVDRASIPGLTRLLGHRRAWMLAAQGVIALGLWATSAGNPGTALGTVITLAVCTAFFGASQDVVMDAWRIEVSDDDTQGVMAAAYQYGYRGAQITAGALPLILAQVYNWNLSYAVMAALMALGALGVLLAPREKAHVVRPMPAEGGEQPAPLQLAEWIGRLLLVVAGALSLGAALTGSVDIHTAGLQALGLLDEAGRDAAREAWKGDFAVWYQLPAALIGLAVIALSALPLPGRKTRPGVYLSEAFIVPLKIFWNANTGSAALILALICVYRLPDFVLNITGPFFTDIGFDKIEVAEARKLWGVIGTSIGVFLGAVSVARIGLMRTLMIGAFAGPVSNLAFIWMAGHGKDFVQFAVINGVDNACSGFAGTALIAYMSSLTTTGFTAVQYAFFSSIYGLPGRLLASQSGRIVEGSAKAADAGGATSGLKGFFAALPDGALATGAAKTGVTPAAMAAGYTTFFLYSAAVGLAAVVLTALVVRRTRSLQSPSAAR